ncbi:MAG: hypothetical protein IJ663_08230, partial [Spirochaetales bacterium]|nr:hypothetical protein [Spirochaetales bacterium]
MPDHGEARSGIILIDNYVDRGTLDILSHKRQGVKVRIITSKDGMNTPAAKAIAQERHAFLEEFLRRYEREENLT